MTQAVPENVRAELNEEEKETIGGTADAEKVRAARRRLERRTHPDRAEGSEAAWAAAQPAIAWLKKREKELTEIDVRRGTGGGGAEVAERARKKLKTHQSDAMAELLKKGPRRTLHVEMSLDDWVELRAPREVEVSVPADERCESCHGTGRCVWDELLRSVKACEVCGGKGGHARIGPAVGETGARGLQMQDCPACDGRGHTATDERGSCVSCQGTGGGNRPARKGRFVVAPGTLPWQPLEAVDGEDAGVMALLVCDNTPTLPDDAGEEERMIHACWVNALQNVYYRGGGDVDFFLRIPESEAKMFWVRRYGRAASIGDRWALKFTDRRVLAILDGGGMRPDGKTRGEARYIFSLYKKGAAALSLGGDVGDCWAELREFRRRAGGGANSAAPREGKGKGGCEGLAGGAEESQKKEKQDQAEGARVDQ